MRNKTIYLALSLLLVFVNQATAQSCYKVTLSKTGLLQPACNLDSAVKVYFHSGACTSDANDCNIPDSTWEHIVGSWNNGVGVDDGLGLMTDMGNGNYEFTWDPDVYYGTSANINIGEGGVVMPSGATIYSIGLAFRSADGSIKGADNTQDCGDIFIQGINSGTPSVVDHLGNPFSPVTFSFCNSLREFPTRIASTEVFPNPGSGNIWIDYTLASNVKNLQVKVFNALGQEVETLFAGFKDAGDHSLQWDNPGINPGVYFLVMEVEDERVTSKIVVAK